MRVREPRRADRWRERSRRAALGREPRDGGRPVDVGDVACTAAARGGDRAPPPPRSRPAGGCCVYAPPEPGAPLGVDGGDVFLRELTRDRVAGRPGRRDMRAALALLQSGAVRAGTS